MLPSTREPLAGYNEGDHKLSQLTPRDRPALFRVFKLHGSALLNNPPNSGIDPGGFAALFAQKSSSINLDTHVREGQDHVEVLPFKARLPLPSPRQFVEQLSSASSAKRAVRPRLVFLRPRGA